MTGLSGSGKSSLAFDTIYADGQRRYMESLSSYARQFLGQMEKPDVDDIQGLSPAISIDQKTTSPQSPLHSGHRDGDLRLSSSFVCAHRYPHCPVCGRPITQQTVDQMVDEVLNCRRGLASRYLLRWCAAARARNKEFEAARQGGFARVRGR